ncbi:PREDICTED: basic 7S globulin-like [Ipomoea nil]|uniref:basic 7S globulin-like n=1 Tax=Ipomoea nil TaxID=35883 RepID=UPI000900C9C8|nr:PREDICTED: basic 7S globulin-like [Ipomoea nil]
MAYNPSLLSLFSLVFLATISLAQRPFFPRAIVIPVSKDFPTSQYVAQLQMGYNLAPLKLVVDVGGPFLWADWASSSQGSIPCGSLKCSMANPKGCTSNEICELQFENPVSKMAGSGVLKEDTIAVELIDEPNAGSFLSHVPNFLFSFVPSFLFQGLGNGVNGVLGLGNSRISLPSQLANTFGIPRKFAVCLSSSNGAIISGDTTYDVSRSMMYTPLISPQNGTTQEYYINVKSIKINDRKLPLNTSLLVLDQEVEGGTRISTVVPYTTLKTTIYHPFLDSYLESAASMGLSRVDPVAPFEVCFSGVGSDVPKVEFVLQSEMVKWRMNSMVKVGDGVMCLGFLDGGLGQGASVVIGGYQLEDNLLEFNLGTSMLGFTSLMAGTSCSHFTRFSMERDSA